MKETEKLEKYQNLVSWKKKLVKYEDDCETNHRINTQDNSNYLNNTVKVD